MNTTSMLDTVADPVFTVRGFKILTVNAASQDGFAPQADVELLADVLPRVKALNLEDGTEDVFTQRGEFLG